MGTNIGRKVWVGVSGITGFDVKVASTLRGLSDSIGASYSTMKGKGAKAEMFTVVVGKELEARSWFCVRVAVRKVGRKGK